MQRRLRKKYVKKLRLYILPLFVSLLLAGGTLYGVNYFVSADNSRAVPMNKAIASTGAIFDVHEILKSFQSAKESDVTDVTDVPVEIPDTVAPDKPTMSYPIGNKITQSFDKISGEVSADTEKVEVNGYVLKKYVPGSGQWSYFLSADQGNMIIGKNTFTVYAYDKAGNKSEALEASIIYMP